VQGVKKPGSISNHSSVIYKNKMYLFGGSSGLKTNETFMAFDPANNMWELVRSKNANNDSLNAPPACDEHTAIVHNEEMIVFGGFIDGDRVNSAHRFNFKSGEWSAVLYNNSECKPSARAGHTAVVDENFMYVFGGKDNDDYKLNDLWRLDLNTDTWEKITVDSKSEMPIGRCGHTSVMYNGHLVIFGGILEITKELNDCYIFNFQTKCWR